MRYNQEVVSSALQKIQPLHGDVFFGASKKMLAAMLGCSELTAAKWINRLQVWDKKIEPKKINGLYQWVVVYGKEPITKKYA